MTYDGNVQVTQRSRVVSEEAGRDRTRGTSDDQRNSLLLIML